MNEGSFRYNVLVFRSPDQPVTRSPRFTSRFRLGECMKPRRSVLIVIIFLALFSTFAWPQSLPNLALSRLNYTVTKRRVNPQGELKTKIDAVDADLAAATQLGKTAEVRRLVAKGLTLLAGKEWTDALDFNSSLVLRADHVFVDSSKPLGLRLEQIYSPSLKLEHS